MSLGAGCQFLILSIEQKQIIHQIFPRFLFLTGTSIIPAKCAKVESINIILNKKVRMLYIDLSKALNDKLDVI